MTEVALAGGWVDWREGADDPDPDDELLPATPEDVVRALGFDPVDTVAKYSEDQPRDEQGRWEGGGDDATDTSHGEEHGGSVSEPVHGDHTTTAGGISDSERASIEQYTSHHSNFTEVNAVLRDPQGFADKEHAAAEKNWKAWNYKSAEDAHAAVDKIIADATQHANNLNAVASRSTLDHDVETYRGVSQKGNLVKQGAKEGDTITLRGLTSTTTDRAHAESIYADKRGSLILSIHAKAGTNAIEPGAHVKQESGTHNADQKELIFKSGQSFRVGQYDKATNTLHLHAE